VATSPPAEPAFPGGGAAGHAGLILFTLSAMQFISIVDFMIVMPLGPLLMDTLGIDTLQFSWVVSGYTLAAGVAGIAAATALDRVGRRSAYIVLSVGLLVGTLACGVATDYPLLVAARCLTGAFGGVLGGLSYAIVADVFPEERRGRATGVLMSAFAVASVVGVPAGIALATRCGWRVPFFVLAALGLPLVGMAGWTMPALTGHLCGTRQRPLAQLLDTLTRPSHRRAFTLTAILMFGAFSVIPYISAFYVSNAGVTEAQLPIVFVAGGLLTLVSTPLVGRLIDACGALPVFRCVVSLAAVMTLVVTHLPAVGLAVAAPAAALMMASNAGRLVAVVAVVTASIEPRRRGGFMSVNASVQHLASGLGTLCGGLILEGGAGEPLRHFGTVGILAVAVTLTSLWFAGRVRPVAA
jgi:DHA1 family inner membrane transport protein